MVGVGTQDTFPEAQAFHDKYDITFDLLWDQSFETWNAFGVTSQPAAVLVSTDGTIIRGWQGAFPEDDVVRLAQREQ